ncbi:GNAT family N-acetyltransferase [Seohaeicola saemankumensis]|uniref:GNAT family N-acetyltransferase n=1 Tax=Seohaeicola TaxID=481178 RepID=UPI0035CF6B40
MTGTDRSARPDNEPGDANQGGIVLRHNTASLEAVLDHLWRCDTAFSPPLSSRVKLPEYAARLMDKSERVEAWHCGRHKETLVGLVALYCNAEDQVDAFITSVSVDKAHQGTGIGRRLVFAALQHAKNAGFVQINLRVHTGAMAARQVYHALGFVESERSGDELTLVRLLPRRSHPVGSTDQDT